MTTVVNINEVLDCHVGLTIDCVDRLLLNAYVPNLQVSGQVVTFLTQHLGFPIPSPALLEKIGNRFRREVKAFAAEHEVPARWVRTPKTSSAAKPPDGGCVGMFLRWELCAGSWDILRWELGELR